MSRQEQPINYLDLIRNPDKKENIALRARLSKREEAPHVIPQMLPQSKVLPNLQQSRTVQPAQLLQKLESTAHPQEPKGKFSTPRQRGSTNSEEFEKRFHIANKKMQKEFEFKGERETKRIFNILRIATSCFALLIAFFIIRALKNSDKLYCNTGSINSQVESNCEPCPSHSKCSGGVVYECEPYYILNRGMCHFDEDSLRISLSYVEKVALQLGKVAGDKDCDNSVNDKITVKEFEEGFTTFYQGQETVLGFMGKIRGWLRDGKLESLHLQTKDDLLFSTKKIHSLSCSSLLLYKRHKLLLWSLLLLYLLLSCLLIFIKIRLNKFNSATKAYNRIKEIISAKKDGEIEEIALFRILQNEGFIKLHDQEMIGLLDVLRDGNHDLGIGGRKVGGIIVRIWYVLN